MLQRGFNVNHPDQDQNKPSQPPETGHPAPSNRPRFLVTAGPTWEPIDQVRYLGNRSSGQMGVAIAEAAAALNSKTTLLRGPGTVEPAIFPDLQDVRFESAADLEMELNTRWPAHDILIMAAAVADFRPTSAPEGTKKFRRGDSLTKIELSPVPDLVGGLASNEQPGQLRIGFALEPASELESAARRKLEQKQLAGIVANPLETMDSKEIDGFLLLADGSIHRAADQPIPKPAFAEWLVSRALALFAS